MNYPWFIKLAIWFLKRNLEKVAGLENLPANSNFILAANHGSYLDAVFLWVGLVPVTKKIIYSLAKEQLKSKFGSFGSKYLGMIYIDTKDKAKCLEVAAEYLKRNEIICVLPEGRRNYDPINLLPGKTGAARLALKAKVPVIPVGIISPKGQGVFQAIKNAFWPKNKAKIIIGRPLNFEKYFYQEMTKESLEKITRETMLKIGELCGKKYTY
ncbi:MAG: lysophospholipid acyltransferase family protein [Patescibacteria group bacterium]